MIYVLLSTYNGEKYLPILLSSIFNQRESKWKLLVRDDGSDDDSLKILKFFQKENKNVVILKEETTNLGIKKSFNLLLKESLTYNDCNYVMFCDQDDVWETDKIEKTLQKMKEIENLNQNESILIHTDLKVVDEKLDIINLSMWNYQNINPKLNLFNNLLIQNTVTGCTMMINKELAKLSYPIPNESIMHDWWIGLVASEFGKISFIDEATIKYRQHQENNIGTSNFGWKYIISKFFIKNSLSKNCIQAKYFLDRYRNYLSVETINLLEDFYSIQTKSFYNKRKIILKYKLFKQGFIRNIGLLVKI